MSAEKFQQVEQDEVGSGDLPTYEDLAAQSGPNSRFGRWRGWVEKRAAERYFDLSPEERTRRRARGWGNETEEPEQATPTSVTPPPNQLHIQTDVRAAVLPNDPEVPPNLPPAPFICKAITPGHLKMNHFGSRFLPHTMSPILCLLSLQSDRLLLIGHEHGLSVLDMFPKEWAETGDISHRGPEDAKAWLIWQGESVHQMSILETESTGDETQGVVLALVSPESGGSPSFRETEPLKTLRMYNLASLISLAKWTVSQQGARPLDLHGPSNAHQTPIKKHRTHGSISIAKGLKSLIDSPASVHPEPHSSSYQNLMPSHSPPMVHRTPLRKDSGYGSPDSAWDMVDDMPLRWATDFVPLASGSSRLVNTSVQSFALWRDDNVKGKGSALLAVVTKANILVYQTPKGERAFHFVKEFYTPMQARSVTFIQQTVQDISRHVSDAGRIQSSFRHVRSDSSNSFINRRASSAMPVATSSLAYSAQLSLFVVFEKKAGWIRLADSAVGEVDMHTTEHMRESSSPQSRKRRTSLDGFYRDPKVCWIPPTRVELPIASVRQHHSLSRMIHILTKGKQTRILPSPLPADITVAPPLRIVTWEHPPSYVAPRIGLSPEEGGQSFLQLIAFGEDIEIQEIPLSALTMGRGKGKGRAEEPLCSQGDIGGSTGFLCGGGHWDHPNYPRSLSRSCSVDSVASETSCNSEDLIAKMRMEQGIYGWCRKGHQDWRVFWVGGSNESDGPS